MIEADRAAMRMRLRLLADAVAAIDPVTTSDACRGLRAELDEPLRLAVVGRVNAGKSTLVNALIGRRIAPTGNAETTGIVTWYRYGAPERSELHLLDGGVVALPRRGPVGPAFDLPVSPSQVSHAVVHLQEATLKDVTLIDTPGLSTVTSENEAATRRAVLEAEQAHALLYVFRDVELADDVTFLREFAAATGARGGTALDSIGVLTHADEFGSGPWSEPDPVGEAATFARRVAGRRTELADVLPVAGRVAEAAAVGAITEQDAAILGALAPVELEDLQDRVALPPTVPEDRVEELVSRLGPYVVAHGRAAGRSGGAALTRWARTAGGSDALRAELRAHYVGRHAQLQAAQALTALDLAADRSPGRAAIRDLVAEVREDPALHPLNELRAWEALRAVEPGSPLLARLTTVIDALDDRTAVGATPLADTTTVRRAARAAAEAARAEAVLATLGAERNAALVLSRSYRRIAERWTPDAGAGRPGRAAGRAPGLPGAG